ncbi:MAG: hypothetical protein K6B28_09645 [Lachnospiraceae bacterium]|nr:hypothetical protein [Lachnospiraceae bacterium]
MGFNLFSSLKASSDIKSLMNGTKNTVMLSDAQLVNEIFDIDVASEELKNREFDEFEEKMEFYEGRREKKKTSLEELYNRIYMLVDEFEEIAPYRNMTDDLSLYNKAVKAVGRKKGNKKDETSLTDSLVEAGITFMNRILSQQNLIYNSPDAEHLIINIYVYYKFNLAMLVLNNILPEKETKAAFDKFEDYLISAQLNALSNPKAEIKGSFGLLGNIAAKKCVHDLNTLDIRLTATLFCDVFLHIPIDLSDPVNFRNVQSVAACVFDLHKDATGGRYYESLTIR